METSTHNSNRPNPTVPTELCKRLIRKGCDKRVTNDTAEAVSEVLRMFLVETRARASIEAECDLEGSLGDSENQENGQLATVNIRADHVTKVAAEILMDFS